MTARSTTPQQTRPRAQTARAILWVVANGLSYLLRNSSSLSRIWLSATGAPAVVVRVGRSVLDFLVQSDLFDGGFPGTVGSRLFAEPRRPGTQTRATLPGEIAPQPLVLDAKPVLHLGQKQQMNKCPGDPSREPRQSYAVRFHDG